MRQDPFLRRARDTGQNAEALLTTLIYTKFDGVSTKGQPPILCERTDMVGAR